MLQIRNRRVVELAAKLAAVRHSTKTEAVLNAWRTSSRGSRARKRWRSGEADSGSRHEPPRHGLEADKEFYDDLSGDL